MPRRKRNALPVAQPALATLPAKGLDRALKKQGRYSPEPWQPGELPNPYASLVMKPKGTLAPYGEASRVELPATRGTGALKTTK